MTIPLTDARLAEIEARAQLAYDGGDPLQTTGYDVPALLAEARRLRGELGTANGSVTAAVHRLQLEVPPLKAERDDWRNRAEAALDEAGALQAEILKALAGHDRLTRRLADAESERGDLRSQITEALHGLADRLDAVSLDCTALTGPVWYGRGWRDAVDALRALTDGLGSPRATANAQPEPTP